MNSYLFIAKCSKYATPPAPGIYTHMLQVSGGIPKGARWAYTAILGHSWPILQSRNKFCIQFVFKAAWKKILFQQEFLLAYLVSGSLSHMFQKQNNCAKCMLLTVAESFIGQTSPNPPAAAWFLNLTWCPRLSPKPDGPGQLVQKPRLNTNTNSIQ